MKNDLFKTNSNILNTCLGKFDLYLKIQKQKQTDTQFFTL